MADSRAQRILRKHNELRSNRYNWEEHWREISQLIMPKHSQDFNTGGYQTMTRGEKRRQHQYDSTGESALVKFASFMESMLTPLSGSWHYLRFRRGSVNRMMRTTRGALTKSLMKKMELYLEEVNDILFEERYASASRYTS